MRCIDLVEEREGNVSIAGCQLGDDIGIARIKLSQLSRVIKEDNTNQITCDMDSTKMKYKIKFEDERYGWSHITCFYSSDNNKINKIEYYMFFCNGYPYISRADFEEMADNWVCSNIFKINDFPVNPEIRYHEQYLENAECEVELQYSKKGTGKSGFILMRITPPVTNNDKSIFNTEAAYYKSIRKLALEKGVDVEQLNELEQNEALNKIGLSVLDINIP